MKVLHLTDVHVDFSYALSEFLIRKIIREREFDVVVCTGDVANTRGVRKRFLSWFDGVEVPKFIVNGNHDIWCATPQQCDNDAEEYGWITMDTGNDDFPGPPEFMFVRDDDISAVMHAMWYVRRPDWGPGNTLHYTNDAQYMKIPVRSLVREAPKPEELDWLKDMNPTFSMSHMCPSAKLDHGGDTPQIQFVNESILDVAKAAGTKTHFYGHSHAPTDTVVDGVRCVNTSFVDQQYKIRMETDFIVDI